MVGQARIDDIAGLSFQSHRWAWGLLALGLAGLLVIQCEAVRASTCETYDEFTYLILGVAIFRKGDFWSMASPMCPPLPILLEYWLPALRAQNFPGTTAWDHEVPSLIAQARLLTTLTVGVPLVLVVFGWVARRRGWGWGALAGALVALSPSVVAHASIATTDACFALFGVVALGAVRRYQARPSLGSFGLLGVALGLALGSKQSAAVLFGVALLELALIRPERRPGATATDHALRVGGSLGVRLVGLVVLAFAVDWGLYGFHLAKFGAAGSSCTVPVLIAMVAALFPQNETIMAFVRDHLGTPLSIDTFVGQMNHAAQGHAAFLMGQHSSRGWWYFFPVAIAIKSTPTELVLFALASFLALRPATWRDPTRRVWLAAGLLLLGAGMASSINIGQRYMLLLYPLVILLGADWLGRLAKRRRVVATALGGVLLVGQAVSAGGIAPHYLSYFNLFCGGPLRGHEYLVDSSLDWGQDLPALGRWLDARGYRRVALHCFGNARPEEYGLRAVAWSASAADLADCDYLAISATRLHGGYNPDISEPFRDLPAARVASSIFVYDLKDPRVRAVYDAVRTASFPTIPVVPAPTSELVN